MRRQAMTAEARGEMACAGEAESRVHGWDHSTHEEFYEYYARASQSETAVGRFRRTQDVILRIRGNGAATRVLDIADIGCGAGTQSMVWAQAGHSVHALDINEPLVQLGRERAGKAGSDIDFRVGSATNLPWGNESIADRRRRPEPVHWDRILRNIRICFGGADSAADHRAQHQPLGLFSA